MIRTEGPHASRLSEKIMLKSKSQSGAKAAQGEETA